MAQTLTPQDIKLLDQTRQRLSQLTTSLTSLQHNLLTSNPLPPYSSLHSQTLILGQALTSLAAHLNSSSNSSSGSSNAPVSGLQLAATSVYPLPVYPGREEEGLLSQLLRKKLEVGVEEWVEQGKEGGDQVLTTPGAAKSWRGLWEWAGVEANGVARKYDWGGDLEEDDEDDDGSDDEKGDARVKMESQDAVQGVGETKPDARAATSKPLSLDEIMRYMTKGEEGKK